MQQRYERTAERTLTQMETLPDFLAKLNVELPQLGKDQQSMLEEKFSDQEEKNSITKGKQSQCSWLLRTNYCLLEAPLSNDPHS
jgi:hypothetical protein